MNEDRFIEYNSEQYFTNALLLLNLTFYIFWKKIDIKKVSNKKFGVWGVRRMGTKNPWCFKVNIKFKVDEIQVKNKQRYKRLSKSAKLP